MGIMEVESDEQPDVFCWILAMPEGGIGDQHIIPGGDLRQHETQDTCWCTPVLIDHEQAGLAYQHKALDNREVYFSGARKYN